MICVFTDRLLLSSTHNFMEWAKQLQEQARFSTAYAEELKDKFEAGQLAELMPYRQFIVWKQLEIAGKKKKPPYNPATNLPASPTDPATWGTYKEAVKALTTGLYNGIGFVFTQADSFAAIDLDHCVHTNRRIDFREEQLIRRIQSYAEYSPNDGAHLIVKAKLPFHTLKRGNLEIFNSGHSMSLTLRHIPGTPSTIADRQAELDELVQSLACPPTEHPTPRVIWQKAPQQITEVERKLIEHWKSEPGNFKRYFEGDRRLWLGKDKKVETKSEADFVLCLMLLTRTHDDVEETKRLFHVSYESQTEVQL